MSELDKTIEIEFKNNVHQIFFNCDKEQLSRVFLNLIKNSIESIQQKNEKDSVFYKNITIELKDYDDHIILVINDNGIGFNNLNNNIKEITTKLSSISYKILVFFYFSKKMIHFISLHKH